MIAAYFGESDPPDLSCVRIANLALTLRAKRDRLRAALEGLAATATEFHGLTLPDGADGLTGDFLMPDASPAVQEMAGQRYMEVVALLLDALDEARAALEGK